jgi:hypothetical protein
MTLKVIWLCPQCKHIAQACAGDRCAQCGAAQPPFNRLKQCTVCGLTAPCKQHSHDSPANTVNNDKEQAMKKSSPTFEFEEPSHVAAAATETAAASPAPAPVAVPEPNDDEQDDSTTTAPELPPIEASELPSIGERPNGLVRKLAAVLGAITRIPKRGWNDHFKYNFATEQDISDALRHLLAEAGVFVFSSIESIDRRENVVNGKTKILTEVRTLHTFIDADSGERFAVKGAGDGEDNSDKGIYKAFTGAMKYFLMKNFLISTGDDPENDSAKGRGGVRGGAPQQQKRTAPTTSDEDEKPVLAREVAGLLRSNLGISSGKLTDVDTARLQKAFKAATEGEFDNTTAMTLAQLRTLRDNLKSGKVKVA